MADARTRFRPDQTRGVASALAKSDGIGWPDEYSIPILEVLRQRPVARFGWDPKIIMQLDPGERDKTRLRPEGFFAPYTTESLLEVFGNPKHPKYSRKLAAALRRRPDIEEDPIFLAGRSAPDTRPGSFLTVLHEATHRGFKKLRDEFGDGWLNAETEEFRDKYKIPQRNAEEIIVRLLDYMNTEMGVTLSDKGKEVTDFLIRKYTNLTGDDLAGKMLADPVVSDLIRRLQGQAGLQFQHEGQRHWARRLRHHHGAN